MLLFFDFMVLRILRKCLLLQMVTQQLTLPLSQIQTRNKVGLQLGRYHTARSLGDLDRR